MTILTPMFMHTTRHVAGYHSAARYQDRFGRRPPRRIPAGPPRPLSNSNVACRSEADRVLDGCFSVRRDDLAGNEIVPVLELAFGSALDNGLGARGANLRERIEFRCR